MTGKDNISDILIELYRRVTPLRELSVSLSIITVSEDGFEPHTEDHVDNGRDDDHDTATEVHAERSTQPSDQEVGNVAPVTTIPDIIVLSNSSEEFVTIPVSGS